jgi:M3 family oligoendopeptidase
MKYSEFHYERISVEEQNELLNERLERFNNAESADEQIAVIKEVDESYRKYVSYASIADLNFNRDVRDEEAKAEKEYYDSIGPNMAEIDNRWEKAVDASPFKSELRREWGDTFLKQIEMDLKTFDPKIMDMLRQETDFEREHSELIAGAKIEFDGTTYNLAGLSPFHQHKDRAVRKRSYAAKFKWFEENAEAFDDLYDRLVKLRHRMATTLGCENFIELAYLRMGRSDYGPKEVAIYRQQIVESVVPVVQKLLEQKKGILGLDHLYFYDGINFKEGDPKPKGTPDEMVVAAQEMYHELSPDAGEFFDLMVDEELLDLVNREGKMPGGFCTGFPAYKRPYIFSNFNGTDGDVVVLTHEAGHAYQGYASRNQPLISYLWPTAESAEIHSMSMEFLTWPWMDKFFGEETERFKYKHLAGSLAFLPYGACVDHFQHWVFEHPDATPRERKEQWSELESIYLPNRDYDDLAFPKSGGFWQMQTHIYQSPFYYIDYTLAQTCAFQYWIRNEENPEETWGSYHRLCQSGGSLPFTGLIKLAELQSPFEEGCLESIVEKVSAWLDGVDVTKL